MAEHTLLQRKKTDPSTIAVDSLRQALATERSERHQQWAEALDRALARVEHSLHQKLMDAAAPDGSLAMVDQTTASRQVEKLCQTQDDLLAQVALLRQKIQCATRCATSTVPGQAWDWDLPVIAGCAVDFESIRGSAESVLVNSEKTTEVETKLIQESVNTDLGGGG